MHNYNLHKFKSSLLANVNSSDLRCWSVLDLINIGTCVTPQNTRTLLQEVHVRLALQLVRLYTWRDELRSMIESKSTIKGQVESKSKTDQKVIKACNFPVSISMKEYLQRMELARIEGEKSMKCLNDLIQLHQNTYMLPYQLMDEDVKSIFETFSKIDQYFIKDVFYQVETRHANAIEGLADAVISARKVQGILNPISKYRAERNASLLNDDSLEIFIKSRLLVQLLCEHYLLLSKGKSTGAVSLDADLLEVVQDAVQDAKQVCDANLGVCPDIHVTPIVQNERGLFFPPPLIRSWIHYALVELCKNAMKSNFDSWDKQPLLTKSFLPPSVTVFISRDSNHLLLKVVDQGVGLNRERAETAFRFASSTSQKRWDRLLEQQSYSVVRDPLGSLGVGLPISRMMMRVFGGDLSLLNNHSEMKINGHKVLTCGCTATIKILYDSSFTAAND